MGRLRMRRKKPKRGKKAKKLKKRLPKEKGRRNLQEMKARTLMMIQQNE